MEPEKDHLSGFSKTDRASIATRQSAAFSFLSSVASSPISPLPAPSRKSTFSHYASSPKPAGMKEVTRQGSRLAEVTQGLDLDRCSDAENEQPIPEDGDVQARSQALVMELDKSDKDAFRNVSHDLQRAKSMREEAAESFLLSLQVERRDLIHENGPLADNINFAGAQGHNSTSSSPMKTGGSFISHFKRSSTDDFRFHNDSPAVPSVLGSQSDFAFNGLPFPPLSMAAYMTSLKHPNHSYSIAGGSHVNAQTWNMLASVNSGAPVSHAAHHLYRELMGSRIILTSEKGTPVSIFTMLTSSGRKPKRRKSGSTYNAYIPPSGVLPLNNYASKTNKPESYAHLLATAGTLNCQGVENTVYNPDYLDDPELKTGKHRTVITLSCFMGSILHPADPMTLKSELNELFKQSHPTVDPTLTLSQIRKIKKLFLIIAQECELELSSVAYAIVYFEKLVLKGIINKENRKTLAAVCLFLACKVNDPKETDYTAVLEAFQDEFSVSSKFVLEHEFDTYSNLDFSLYVPCWELMPHLKRIFQLADVNSLDEYGGGWEGWAGSAI